MKAVFVFFSVLVWVAAATGVFITWGSGVAMAERILPSAPAVLYITFLVVGGMLGLYVNSLLKDMIFGKAISLRDMSQEQARSSVHSVARKELASGNYRRAVVHYEDLGLYPEALKIAEEHDDHDLMARISWRMGKFERARNHYLRVGNFQGAGNQSVLMHDMDGARKNYSKAADALEDRKEGRIKYAEYLDRAHRHRDAIAVYEELGDLVKAAECCELLGDWAGMARYLQQWEAVKLYEQRKAEGEDPIARDARRMKAKRSAKELKAFGDLYRAAWLYREVEDWNGAAECYEHLEEWERAVKCYKLAGREDKVAMLAPRIQPKETSFEEYMTQMGGTEHQGAAPFVLPAPSQAPIVTFVPLAQQPVKYIALSPDMIKKAGKLLPSEGASREAWEKLAFDLRQRGDFAEAAELLMRLGRVDEAVDLMAKGKKPLEAALMAMGVGDFPQAAEYLVEGLEHGNDESLGLLLGEMLIRLGDMDMAARLLRRRLAPRINRQNAGFVYRYAQLFEDNGGLEYAERIYRSIIVSGAQSAELIERHSALARQLDERSTREKMMMLEERERRGDQEGNDDARNIAGKLLEGEADASSGSETPAIPQTSMEPEETKILESADTSGYSTPVADEDVEPYEFEPPRYNPYLRNLAMPGGREGGTKPDGKLGLEGTHLVSFFRRDEPTVDATQPSTPNRRTTASAVVAKPDDPFATSRRYDIVRELGKGGMGVVYEARDTILNRRLALKLVNSGAASPDNLKQFLLEARAIAQLTHPNVIMIFDVGLMDLKHYIAMEFIDGVELRTFVNNKGPLPLKEALGIFVQMCEGLKAVHEAGIVHRDIKPSNVLMTKDGRAKIVDFGLAKLEPSISGTAEETMFRTAGTPGYMPPEQIRGEDLVPACDIYALGITLFSMLVGAPPHQAKRMEKRMDIFTMTLNGELPSIGEFRNDIPEGIEHLYRYCTATETGERYKTIDAFLPVARQWHDAAQLPAG